jgi:hypothetical protein
MTSISKFHLIMPSSLSHPDTVPRIESDGVIVIIGANGAGKSRLGAWLDINSDEHRDKVHRISAQKSLTMSPSYNPSTSKRARSILLYGNEQGKPAHKAGGKWSGKPSTAMLDDIQWLMTYLISEEFEESTKYKKAAQETDSRVVPPQTKLDKVKKIWEEVLPHRKLLINGSTIETQASGDINNNYYAAEICSRNE